MSLIKIADDLYLGSIKSIKLFDPLKWNNGTKYNILINDVYKYDFDSVEDRNEFVNAILGQIQ